MASEAAAVLAAAAAVLGVMGGILRYLVRMAASMERTSALAQSTFQSFEAHVTSSATFHAALTDRVALHNTEIAVLQTRLDERTSG